MSRPYFDLAQRVSGKTGLDPNFVWAQWYHESGGFSSQLARENFNFGGVTQETPNGEDNKQPDGGNYYKVFNSPEEYADWYAEYIPLYRDNGLFEARTIPEFASALRRGGYYTADESEYTNGMLNALGMDPIQLFLSGTNGAYGVPEGTPNPQEFPKRSWWEQSVETWKDYSYGGGGTSVLRSGWTTLESMASTGHWQVPGFSNFSPSQAEVDLITKTLPGDHTAQQFVLMNAMSSDHLHRLLQMKREDAERAARVAEYDHWTTYPAALLGMLSDPLIFVPVLNAEAMVAKGITRLGAAGLKMSQSKIVHYGGLAATNAAIVGADRYLAQRYGGYEPNYGAAMALGAVVGLGMGYVKNMRKLGVQEDIVNRLDGTVDNMESHAIAMAMDAPLPSDAGNIIKTVLKKHHDSNYAASIAKEGSDASVLFKNEQLFIMPKAAAKEAAQKLGITLEDDFKGFDIPGLNVSVLTKEHVTAETLEGIIAHEVAVHEGLSGFLGKAGYDRFMGEAQKRVDNPQGKHWKKAVKTGGDIEEVVGHWVEQSPVNDNLYKRLKGSVESALWKRGIKNSLSDEAFRDIIQRSLKHQVYKDTPIRVNPDGSTDIYGIRYSKNNIFNVNTWAKYFDETGENVEKAQRGWYPKWFGKMMETNWAFKNPYGILKNSKTHSGHILADLLGHDPKQRERISTAVVSAEKQAEHVAYHLNTYEAQIRDIRTKYLNETAGRFGIPSPLRMRQFDAEVIECHNAKYAGNTSNLTRTSWDPAVEEAAAKLKEYMEGGYGFAQTAPEQLGGVKGHSPLVDYRRTMLDPEFTRVADQEKLTTLLGNYFRTTEEAKEFFTTYARQFAKRDVVTKRLAQAEEIRYTDALDEWEKAGSKGDAPVKQEITPEAVEKWIEKEAAAWGEGQVDKERSLMTFKGSGRYNNDTATFLLERLPLNTAGELPLPDVPGKTFCFDRDLRDMSLDRLLPRITKRLSGEIGLNNTLGDLKARTALLDRFAQELAHAENRPGGISSGQARLEKRAVETMIDRIRGTQEFEENRTVWDGLSTILRNLTYSDVGGNMVFAQLGELGGAIGYIGPRILTSVIPSIGEAYRSATVGREMTDLIKEVHKRSFGETLRNRVWDDSASYESRIFREMSERGSKIAYYADKANEASKLLGKIASAVNRLPGVTNRMIQEAQLWTILDTLQWAKGEKFRLRNPFSDYNLKAAGIRHPVAIQTLKDDINKYIGSGKVDDKAWLKQSPTTYFQWKILVDNNALRAFQQETVGNTPMLKEANWFTRAFFQFKDYTFRAVNGQTMRALSSHQIDDGLAALFSMGSNMLMYRGLVEGRAWARYPHDEAKRDAYRKEQCSWERLGFAAVTRGIITGSLPGFATDAYEVATGTSMFRTTVDNSRDPGKRSSIQSSQNSREFVGNLSENLAKQIPAANTINKTIHAPIGAYHLMSGRGSQQDIQDVMNRLPLNGWLGMTLLATEIKDYSGLPQKTPK